MYYFEKALIETKKSNHELAIELAEKGIKKNEPYSYYLLGDDDFNEERIKKEFDPNDPYLLATLSKIALDEEDIDKGIELANKSNTGLAFYNLYLFFKEHNDNHNEKLSLIKAYKLRFSLAFLELTDKYLEDEHAMFYYHDANIFINSFKKSIKLGYINGYKAYIKYLSRYEASKRDLIKANILLDDLLNISNIYKDTVYTNKINIYHRLKEYDLEYNLCFKAIKEKVYSPQMFYTYLADLYSNKKFAKYDIVKALIYYKASLGSFRNFTSTLEVAKIYNSIFKNKYMAQEYVRLFKKQEEYNDLCFSLFEDYWSLIHKYESSNYKLDDNNNYYKIGMKYLNDNDYNNAYDSFFKGILLDQKKCYKSLIMFYSKGIVVEKDIIISGALKSIYNSKIIFKKDIDKEGWD